MIVLRPPPRYEQELKPRDVISVELLEAEMARQGLRLADYGAKRRPDAEHCATAGH